MTERELQATIVDLCRWLRLPVFHPYDSRRSEPGWPDLFILGPHGFMWRELKTEVGKVTDAQQRWLGELREAGGDAAVWRPGDWRLGTVRRELERLAKG